MAGARKPDPLSLAGAYEHALDRVVAYAHLAGDCDGYGYP